MTLCGVIPLRHCVRLPAYVCLMPSATSCHKLAVAVRRTRVARTGSYPGRAARAIVRRTGIVRIVVIVLDASIVVSRTVAWSVLHMCRPSGMVRLTYIVGFAIVVSCAMTASRWEVVASACFVSDAAVVPVGFVLKLRLKPRFFPNPKPHKNASSSTSTSAVVLIFLLMKSAPPNHYGVYQ